MKITIPATSANLGPGFDSLGLALSLFNQVKITPSSYFSISIKGEGSDNIWVKKNNSFVSIFNETYKELTDKKDTFRFEFTNNIPFSRGLGSSSAVVVGAIASAYYLAKLKIEKNLIASKSLKYESHPDNIVPAIFGGFISAVIDNGKIVKIKKDLPDTVSAVVVIPNVSMSTVKSRALLPKEYKMSDVVFNISRASLLSAAFVGEDWEILKTAAQDKIHEDIRMSLLPELFEVKKIAMNNGALMSTLSGSGSTFFNLVYKKDSQKLAYVLQKRFEDFRVLELNFNNSGFEIIED